MANDLDDRVACVSAIRVEADTTTPTHRPDPPPGLNERKLAPQGRLPLKVIEAGSIGCRIEADEGHGDLEPGQDLEWKEFRLLPGG